MIASEGIVGVESQESENARFLRFMSRHLVVLTGIYESYDEGKPFHTGIFAFSGFVMNLHDRFYWITAGHCLDEKFDRPIKAGKLKVLECGFADYFGDKATNNLKIPFSYEVGCGFYIDNREMGLDFGIIPLDYLTVQNLIANGIKAVGRENWVNQKDLQFDHYKIQGVPSHLTECKISPSGVVTGGVSPVMIGINRLDPNELERPVASTWFVGQIPPEVTIKSIEGMSGGPIYGFRKNADGQWTYFVVALQSWWREELRITFGCSVPLFAEALHESIAEAQTAQSPDPTMASGRDGAIKAVKTRGRICC